MQLTPVGLGQNGYERAKFEMAKKGYEITKMFRNNRLPVSVKEENNTGIILMICMPVVAKSKRYLCKRERVITIGNYYIRFTFSQGGSSVVVLCCLFSNGVRVSVTFHLTCVRIIFSSVWVAEWSSFWK